MAWQKTAYWMAVAVLAITAGNSFIGRHSDWAGELANRSLQMADQVSARAMAYTNLAEARVGRGESRLVRAQTKMACVQTRLASMEVIMARRQAGLANLATERAHLAEMEQLRSRLICPRTGLAVVIPQPRPMQHQGSI